MWLALNYSFGFYLDNYTNGQINNEKFVIAMILAGGILLYWGYLQEERGLWAPDEHGWNRSNY